MLARAPARLGDLCVSVEVLNSTYRVSEWPDSHIKREGRGKEEEDRLGRRKEKRKKEEKPKREKRKTGEPEEKKKKRGKNPNVCPLIVWLSFFFFLTLS